MTNGELRAAYEKLTEQYQQKQLEVDVLRRECDAVHEYLDAAGAPQAERLPERFVAIAKEWFRSHSTESSDHISARLRAGLLRAGEMEFVYGSPPCFAKPL